MLISQQAGCAPARAHEKGQLRVCPEAGPLSDDFDRGSDTVEPAIESD